MEDQSQEQQAQAPNFAILEIERAEYLSVIRRGAHWFIWIAAISIINSLINNFSTGQINFIAGLGITLIVDGIVLGLYGSHHFLALVINGLIAAGFVFIAVKARTPLRWDFIVGLSIYAVDALILLRFMEWKGVIFHGIAGYFILKGYDKISAYNEVNEKLTLDHLLTDAEEGM